ncbi:EamA family transporter [Schinkia azotoformans]|uniref:EamA family transporter n=1 Tax=Schinkia azotoformans TaxID=1454 RepID=UPI002DBF1238|nr:EamA family transporter [Schinkia azotoformans]MEC1719006.1 EamA family transporter [Schinkia azotoformans]MED4411964.1 EamA family transporter [Schinkia azotoformans]
MFLHRNHEMYFGSDIYLTLLLMFAGILTVLRLLWFTEGLKRISLTTIGFFQYITPTITFLLGVFVFENKITLMHWISSSFIWLSLVVFSIASWKGKNKKVRVKANFS